MMTTVLAMVFDHQVEVEVALVGDLLNRGSDLLLLVHEVSLLS